jgi:hypothetical protein
MFLIKPMIRKRAETNLEETQSFDRVGLVKSESMVDASRENQEIACVYLATNP